MQTLQHILHRLADSGVDLVGGGGYAGVLHGSSLVTRDLDVCAVRSPATVERLREVLGDLHPQHRLTPQKPCFLQVPKPGEAVQNLHLQTDWGAVDFLSSILGVGDFERLKTKAEAFEIAGRKCRLIALEDLIAAKEAMGREKDLLARKELHAIAARRAQRNDENPPA